MAKKQPPKAKPPAGRKDVGRIYELKVELIAGMVTRKFLDANPVVSRTIEMRGDQTLEALHRAIFKAFDRFDHHLYEFQFGKGPQAPEAQRYVMDSDEDLYEPEPGEDAAPSPWRRTGPRPRPAASTTLDDLELKARRRFFYWFDFGDDWWHVVRVAAVKREAPYGRYPRIIEKVGESPPQYPSEEDYEEDG